MSRPVPASLVERVLEAGTAAQRAAALTLLARLAGSRPDLRAALGRAVSPYLPDLVDAAVSAEPGADPALRPRAGMALLIDTLSPDLRWPEHRPHGIAHDVDLATLGASVEGLRLAGATGVSRATIEHDLALRLYTRGEPERALPHARSAVAQFEGMAPAGSSELGYALTLVGAIQAALGDDEAADSAREAVTVLIRAWDGSERSQVGTAQACNNLGVLLVDRGDVEAGLYWLREARRIAASLAQWKPERFSNLLADPVGNLLARDLDRDPELLGVATSLEARVGPPARSALQVNRAWVQRAAASGGALTDLVSAIGALRRLTDVAPARFGGSLVRALWLLGDRLAGAGRDRDAASVWLEAAGVERLLPGEPARQSREAARLESMAAQSLWRSGATDAAVALALQAMDRWPEAAAGGPVHAHALMVSAQVLSRTDARSSAELAGRASQEYRLAAEHTPRHLADLALALCVAALATYDFGDATGARGLAVQAVDAAERYRSSGDEPLRDVGFAETVLRALTDAAPG